MSEFQEPIPMVPDSSASARKRKGGYPTIPNPDNRKNKKQPTVRRKKIIPMEPKIGV